MAKAIIPTQIKGEITMSDGTVSDFTIFDNNEWTQWGSVSTERLGRTVDVMDALASGLTDAGIVLGEEGPPVLDGHLIVRFDSDEMLPRLIARLAEYRLDLEDLGPGDEIEVKDDDDTVLLTVIRSTDGATDE